MGSFENGNNVSDFMKYRDFWATSDTVTSAELSFL